MKKEFVINIILVIIITFLGIKLYHEWLSLPSESKLNSPHLPVLKQKVKKRLLPAPKKFGTNYDVIIEKNLFSPERKGEIETKDRRVTSSSELKKKLELVGTFLRGNYRVAIIKLKDNKKGLVDIKTYKEGDLIEKYKIKKIIDGEILLISRSGSVKLKIVRKSIPPSKPPVKYVRKPKPSPIARKERIEIKGTRKTKRAPYPQRRVKRKRIDIEKQRRILEERLKNLPPERAEAIRKRFERRFLMLEKPKNR